MSDERMVWMCDIEWCDEGYHVEGPEEFDAFRFDGDVEEYSGDGIHLIPLSEGQITKGYRFRCGTWFDYKPPRKTEAEARRENGQEPLAAVHNEESPS